MRKTTYQCNLCRETKDKKQMIALYFKSATIPQRYVLDRSKIDDCDNHICEQCISIIMLEAPKELIKD